MIKLRVKQSVENKGIFSRAAIVHSSEVGDIETPQPIFSNSESNKLLELNKSKFLPSKFIPENKVMEITRHLTQERLQALSSDSKVFDKYKKELLGKTSRYKDRIRVFRPDINKKTRLTDKANIALADLADQADFDWITVQEESCASSADAFTKRLNNTREQILQDVVSKKTKDLVPTLWAMGREDIFQAKIDSIIDNGFKVIGILSASPLTYWANYEYLRKISNDKDILTVLFDCDRTTQFNHTTAMNHFMTLYNFDLIAIKNIIKLSPEAVIKLKEKKYEPKLLDGDSLGYLHLSDFKQKYGARKLGKSILDANLNTTQFVKKFEEVDLLQEAIALRNASISYSEFAVERQEIADKNLDSYIKSKAFLLKAANKAFNYQSRLI